MPPVIKTPTPSAQGLPLLSAARNRATLEAARAAGILDGAKRVRVVGRVSVELIAAAKSSAGVSSEVELIEIALARLALEDDFGAQLANIKGTVSRDIGIEF